MSKNNQDFLKELSALSQKQAALNNSSPLPKVLSPITSFIGEHSWQVLLLLSIVSSILMQVIKKGL